MSSDILRRLTFGVKKVKRTAKQPEKDENAALRLRSLPENIREELAELRKRLAGEESRAEQPKNEENGLELFSGRRVVLGEAETRKRKLSSKQNDDIQLRIDEKIAHLRRLNRIFTWGEAIPEPLIDFSELELVPESVLAALDEFGIREPTPIQMQAIPLMQQRRDVLCSAPTGSGKTLAFALPVILEVARLRKLEKYKKAGSKLLAIVLEPTRELADQTYRQFVKFAQNLDIKTALYEDELPTEVDVLVSTPNRLVHHLQSADFSAVRWLVVDESDRLFDHVGDTNFREQLASIYKACSGKFTRRAFFSATFSFEVEQWCKENLTNVAMLCIGERNSANTSVKQELVFAGSEHGKLLALQNLLQARFEPPALIFVQSKERAKELVAAIKKFEEPIPVGFISAEKSQKEREETLEAFRAGQLWILVCTELMGRGLDLKNVNLVINFDLPASIVNYIHRIGRTGRAGRSGRAVTYFTEADTDLLRPIATVIHQAGFDVPAYMLTLKKMSKSQKHEILVHAPKRKHLARVGGQKLQLRRERKRQKEAKAHGAEAPKKQPVGKKSEAGSKKPTGEARKGKEAVRS